MRAEMRKKYMEENQALAKSQFLQHSYMTNNVFKNNQIDASFFEQFNTTSR